LYNEKVQVILKYQDRCIKLGNNESKFYFEVFLYFVKQYKA
jgi:hypothetical protein